MKPKPTNFHSSIDRRGFTLIEILVVLTIIIIIALAAIPAFRFITGSRSIEGTQNIIAAMLSRSRSQALADGENRGVFFYLDPVNDRTTMALVGQVGGDFDQYHGWSTGNSSATQFADAPANISPAVPTSVAASVNYYDGNNGQQPQSQIITIGLARTTDADATYLGIQRQFVRHFGCIISHAPTPGNHAPSANWLDISISLNLVAGTDLQILPQGVGVQLLNSNPTGIANFDRYLRLGCIMFDRDGKFTSVPWLVRSASPLGKALYLNINTDLDITPPPGNSQYVLYSQFGVVLYDRQTFLAQTSSSGNYSEGDWIFSPSFQGKTYFQNPPAFSSSPKDEMGPTSPGTLPMDEETWLDSNSLPLLVHRYNGTLIKGE